MSERLKGSFIGCPYHDDDYEACIQYSGQAPCDPPDGWRLVPADSLRELRSSISGDAYMGDQWELYQIDDWLKAAPSPGQEE